MRLAPLTEKQLDLLQEVSNIGVGHAATALSRMLNRTIHLHVPRVTVTRFAEVPDLLGGAERVVAGVFLEIWGAVRGDILMVFPLEDAERLVGDLSGETAQSLLDSEMATSIMLETGNILASAYLNALGQLLRETLIPSLPRLAIDMAGAVADCVLIELGRSGDLALMLETEFFGESVGQETIRGHFFLLPDPATLQGLLALAGEAE